MSAHPRRIGPSRPLGWAGVGLGFGLLVVILVTFILCDNVTDGGSQMAPIWLKAVVICAVLAVAVHLQSLWGFVLARRTRRSSAALRSHFRPFWELGLLSRPSWNCSWSERRRGRQARCPCHTVRGSPRCGARGREGTTSP